MRKAFLVFALLCATTLLAQTPVLRVGRLNLTRGCNYEGFTGSTMGAKLTACVTDLPAGGGTADATGFEGAQSWATDPFAAITKNVHFTLGAATITAGANITIPANVTLELRQGTRINCNGNTITINGSFIAPLSTVFTSCDPGDVVFGTHNTTTLTQYNRVLEVYPQWWGALANGKACSDAVMTASDATLTSATCTFASTDVGKIVIVEGAGASSDVHVSSIASYTSATSVELVDTAGTSTSGALAVAATDDTAAITAAIAAHYRVRFISGIYGISALRIRQGTQLIGSTNETTVLSRMAIGAGGGMIAGASGEVMTKVTITDITLYGNQVGTGLHGIDFATAGNSYAYGNASWMDRVKVYSASGNAFQINSNVGYVGQLWAMNLPGSGTPAALSTASESAFSISNTNFTAELLSAEGRFEGAFNIGEMYLAAQGSRYGTLQIESLGAYTSTDAIQFTAPNQTVGTIYAQYHTGSASRRYLVQIEEGNVCIDNINHPDAVAITLTDTLRDIYANPDVTIAAASARRSIPRYCSMISQASVHNDGYKTHFMSRLTTALSTITAANDLALGYVGNVWQVSGSTQVNRIDTTDWPIGSTVTLIFTGAPLVTHNTAAGGNMQGLYLAGAGNLQVVANETLVLTNNGTVWYQVGGSRNSGGVGLSTSVTVRNSAGTGTCTIDFDRGRAVSTSC